MAARNPAPPQMDREIPPESGVSDVDSTLTCLGLLRDLLRDKEKQRVLITDAERRERWVLGEAWTPRDPLMETIHAEVAVPDLVVTENLLYPLSLTYTARVNEGKVDPVAMPTHPTPENVAQADATNAVLDYERRACEEDRLCAEGTQLAQYHGDVLYYPRWDRYAGPHRVRRAVDATGAAPGSVDLLTGDLVREVTWEYGAIVEDVVAAPDYWTDMVDDYARASYVVVRWVIARHEARAAMLAAGWDYDDVDASAHLDNPADLDVKGVEVFEIWCKPGCRFARGLRLLVVGRCVTEAEAYPLEHGELPGAVQKIGKVRGSPRGKTHVADAIHQQKLVNNSLRAIQSRLVVAGSAILAGPDEMISQVPRGGFKRIPTQLPRSKDPRWISGDDVPASLFNAYQNARRALYDVFGVNEATSTGGDPTATKSGKQMEIAQHLDAQKFTPARDDLQRARRRVAIQKVELARQYWTEQRLVAVVGPGGVYESRWLAGADVGGEDVVIEIASGILNSRLAGQKTAEERGAAGLVSPQEAAEESRTGLPRTVADAGQEARIDAQALAALRGQPQQPLPDVDAGRAARRLRDLLASPLAKQGNGQALAALAQAYENAARQAAMAPAQGQTPGVGRAQPGTPPAQQGKTGVTETAKERAAAQNGAVQ